MRKPIIAVDMDDTICHLVKRAIYHNNNDFPTHLLRYEEMLDWNTDHLRHPDCTQEIFYGRPGLYEELELFDEHVVGEMEKLHYAYDVIIVTANFNPSRWWKNGTGCRSICRLFRLKISLPVSEKILLTTIY